MMPYSTMNRVHRYNLIEDEVIDVTQSVEILNESGIFDVPSKKKNRRIAAMVWARIHPDGEYKQTKYDRLDDVSYALL